MRTKSKSKKSKNRASRVLIVVGLVIFVVSGTLLIADYLWTESSIQKHAQYADERTPALISADTGAEPGESGDGSDDEADIQEEGDVLSERPDLSADRLDFDWIEDNAAQADAAADEPAELQPAPYSTMLDEETRRTYGMIGGRYPDFKGWIEMPGYNISYALFVDPTDVTKYERHDRDGNLSKMGEVGYIGDPFGGYNYIVYGHSLSNRQRGFQPIDNYPDFQVTEAQRRIFVDLTETGERREYRVIYSRYFAQGDNAWFRYTFADKEDHSNWFASMTGYTGDVDQTLIVYTCKNSSRTWNAVLFAVPVA